MIKEVEDHQYNKKKKIKIKNKKLKAKIEDTEIKVKIEIMNLRKEVTVANTVVVEEKTTVEIIKIQTDLLLNIKITTTTTTTINMNLKNTILLKDNIVMMNKRELEKKRDKKIEKELVNNN